MDTATDERRDDTGRLRRKLERARRENQILEDMIEDRTRSLFGALKELQVSKDHLENVLASLSAAVITTDADGVITTTGGRAFELTGRSEAEMVGRRLDSVLVADVEPWNDRTVASTPTCEATVVTGDGRSTPVLVTWSALGGEEGDGGAVFTAIDITRRKQLESELRHAQRLESIGSLAAGVAHELNTPIQYVVDSVQFLADAIDDLFEMEQTRRATCDLAAGRDGVADLVKVMRDKEEELDLAFTRDELPAAVDRAVSGLKRVSGIVKAMHRYSHPGEDVVSTDLNQIVETAVTLARHEYKYVADVELELGSAPSIRANKVQLSQVLVNLLINAAHAIEDRMENDPRRGTIRITTERSDSDERGDGVSLRVTDDGGGIPEAVRDRVFEPFFTTKAVGRGSGQGLALARATVVDGHGGRITLEVDEGVGTTFDIWLPREDRR